MTKLSSLVSSVIVRLGALLRRSGCTPWAGHVPCNTGRKLRCRVTATCAGPAPSDGACERWRVDVPACVVLARGQMAAVVLGAGAEKVVIAVQSVVGVGALAHVLTVLALATAVEATAFVPSPCPSRASLP